MAKRRRTKTKRTRIANSRKMARSRTKKLRKKKMKGGTGPDKIQRPYTTRYDENGKPVILKREAVAEEEALLAKQEADETAAAESLAEKKVGTAPPSRRVTMSKKSKFNRYDKDKSLCGIHTEKDPCDEQYGCNWVGNKCLPSSSEMNTGEPTKDKPSSKEYLTDEEKKNLEDEYLQLLNKLLLASFGYDENGDNRIPKLVLTDAGKLSGMINEDEANKLIQRIDDKASDMETMIANKKKYVFPKTGGMGGPADAVKQRMDILKTTLLSGIKEGIITDDSENSF